MTPALEHAHHLYEDQTGDLEIRIYPNPVLTEISEPLAEEEFGPELFRLGAQMIEVMRRSDGVGLAAPQVGMLKRLFVMKSEAHGPVILCNPEVEMSGEITYRDEGCLSLPGITGQVSRPSEVRMKFRTPMGASAAIQLRGLDARIVQHEVDHLDGILFFDRMPRNLKKQVQRSLFAAQQISPKPQIMRRKIA